MLVPRTSFPTPAAFLFLYGTPLYLTFRDHDVAAWDYNGKLVTRCVTCHRMNRGVNCDAGASNGRFLHGACLSCAHIWITQI